MTEEQKKYYNAMKKLGSKKPQKPIPRPLVSQLLIQQEWRDVLGGPGKGLRRPHSRTTEFSNESLSELAQIAHSELSVSLIIIILKYVLFKFNKQ